MLREMSIRHFAIIEQIHLTFDNGFHVLTGETGAGKSILFDALSLVVGGRGSAEFVRHGAKKAEVEALFEIADGHPAHNKLKELGLESEDGVLLIRRDISLNGKSTCRLNGQVITLSMLKQVGAYLLDIHGQHEHETLLHVEEHLSWLDTFGGTALLQQRNLYSGLFREYQRVTTELRQIRSDEREATRRIDLLTFQRDEIAAARLVEGEDEELQQEHNRLAHGEKLMHSASNAFESLYGDGAGMECLNRATGELEEIIRYDESLAPVLEMVQSAYYQVEEATRELARYRDELEFDPGRLAEVEDRISVLDQMKRKYGESIPDIIRHGQQAEEELQQLVNRDERISELETKQRELQSQLEEAGGELTQLRKEAASRLEQRVEQELGDLMMGGTRFAVVFQDHVEKEFFPNGLDRVEYQLAPNPGEPLRPLVKIASGGELSRIMLALKTIFSDIDGIQTMIFDEIDTGVSGRAAQAIAEKIARLARGCQILCVTHLPQVACMADVHFHLFKEVVQEKTRTRVKQLTDEGRTMELARMLGGVEVTDTTRTHALEMLRLAYRTKQAM
ncbi:DNA repair protein RecN [Kroppenstedtia pulmonis]|uniref:DNA repair protein RecN n=1 Tax=Kroppenstedtia pulmonis TaxID=1380685 RepID=A0A7D4BJA4_9BACL|nr:DNA repair protein RecN [Kroppenstedtia pulmonis]QKG84230.1 DNA repair protein RecN [Kroppenstedtia pulmonis]